MSSSVAVIPECHPKITETFIAQAVRVLKVSGLRTKIYSPCAPAFRARLDTQGQRLEDNKFTLDPCIESLTARLWLADQEVV